MKAGKPVEGELFVAVKVRVSLEWVFVNSIE